MINQQLQPRGIFAKATIVRGCLKIIFEADKVPNQDSLVSYVKKALTKLDCPNIQEVKIYAKQVSNEFPVWQDEFKFTEDVSAFNHSQRKIPFDQDSTQILFILFTIFWWVGYPLLFVPYFEIATVGVLCAIASVVFSSLLLYRHWWLLQGFGARTTPGKAVGFSFIPFYCFYWWFIAFVGLAQDNNKYMSHFRIKGSRMTPGIAVAVCILGILSFTIGLFPIIDIILGIPSAILGFLFVLQQKICLLAIIEHRESNNF